MIDHESNSSSTIRENQVYIKEVDLPEIGEEELLVKIVSNSVCLSTYKAAIRGGDHKRVPDDVSKEHPVITGHEFGGYIVKVGEKMDVKNYAIEKVPEDADVIVTHENLLERAQGANPGIRIVTIQNFLKDQNIDDLYEEIVQKNQK